MQSFPKLFGVSSTGKIKEWEIQVHEQDEMALIKIIHGQLNGKLQSTTEKVREGKNLGKSNETTPYQQALLQAESKWKKQKDKNYIETIPEVEDGKGKSSPNELPMLAHKYLERKHNLVWPVYAQPKFNGVRCLIRRENGVITFLSRKGKRYKNFGYMIPELMTLMEDGQRFDGEMYNHGDITFQELCSLVKEEKNPDIESLKKYVKFYNYDVVRNEGYGERIFHLFEDGEYVRKVETKILHTEAEVMALHDRFVDEGYEGIIIRSGGHEPYRYQYRVPHLLKFKKFIDKEFRIIGGKEGIGKDEGQCIFQCIDEAGRVFDAKCKGPNRIREEQWNNLSSYIGKQLTVRFQSYTDAGIPLFPVGIVVRDYE